MKTIRILRGYLMPAITVIMAMIISFPVQAQTINQKQAKATVQVNATIGVIRFSKKK